MQKAFIKWTEIIGRPKRSDIGSESQVITDVADAADIQASFEEELIDTPNEWDPIPDPPVPADESPGNVALEEEVDPPDNITKQPSQRQ
jgi:hypothetical protein